MGSFSEPGPSSPFVTPPGWSCHVSPDGQTVYTNNITEEQVGAAGRWAQTVVGSLPLPLYTEVPARAPCQPKTVSPTPAPKLLGAVLGSGGKLLFPYPVN